MVDLQASFDQQLLDITIRKGVAKVPANVHRFSFVAVPLLVAGFLGLFPFRSFSWAQNAGAHKGVALLTVWLIIIALFWFWNATVFWRRLVREFSYDGRVLRFAMLGIPEMQTRHLAEIAEVGEWRGRGGPLGYRLKFRDGAKFYLQNGVSNARAVAEQIRYDLLGQAYGSFNPKGTATMNRRAIYLGFLIVVAVCAGWLAFRFTTKLERDLPPEITPTEFLSEVTQGHVAKILIEDRKFISGVSSTRGPFRTKMPVDDALVKKLRSRGVVVEFASSSDLIP